MKNSVSEIFSELIEKGKHFNVKLLGDSITHGVGGSGFSQNGEIIVPGYARSPYCTCWANSLKAYLEEKYDSTVNNNACTGTTIEFVINNFDLLTSSDDDVVICTIGTNNRHQYMKDGPKKSKEEMAGAFLENIKRLYKKFSDAKLKVIFFANIPASQSNECDGEEYWRVLNMGDINAAYKKGAEELGFPFVSLYELFTDYCEREGVSLDSLLCDGLHPNNDGYAVMFSIIKSALGV